MLVPIVGTGGDLNGQPNPYRPKISGLADHTAIIPSNADGTPKFNWCVVLSRAADWSIVDADATLERLFGIDLPDTLNTFAELKAFLQSKTVADIPQARRTALNTRLTNHGLDTSQVTLSTTWWQVLRGIYTQVLGSTPAGDGLTL